MKRIVIAALSALLTVGLAGCTTETDPKVISWAEAKYGVFEPFTLVGNGQGSVPLPPSVHAGYFTVDQGDLVTDFVIGASGDLDRPAQGAVIYTNRSGTAAVFGVDPGAAAATKIVAKQAAGRWSVTVHPIRDLESLPEAGEVYGVYLYSGPRTTVTPGGDLNFDAVQFTDKVNLVASVAAGAEHNHPSGRLVDGPSVVAIAGAKTLTKWVLTRH